IRTAAAASSSRRTSFSRSAAAALLAAGALRLLSQLLVPDHGLYVVAVGIEHECGVAVLFAWPRSAVVLPSGFQCRAIEGVDRGFAVGMEREVTGCSHLAARDPEVVASALDESEGVAVSLVHLVSERRERSFIDFPAGRRIAAPQTDMLNHGASLPLAERRRTAVARLARRATAAS